MVRRLPQFPPELEHHRDTEQALAAERLAGPRDAALAGELAFEMHVRSDAQLEGKDLGPLACRHGCSWCCVGGNVDVMAVEALAIAEDLRSRLSPEELAAVTARVKTDAADTRTRSVDERFSSRVACPLLDRERGECIAYEYRPSNCRGWVSYDAKACEANVTLEEENVPSNLLVKAFHAVGMMSLSSEVGRVGLDGRSFQIGPALEVALCEPDAAERWAAGERLFDQAEVDRKGGASGVAQEMMKAMGFGATPRPRGRR